MKHHAIIAFIILAIGSVEVVSQPCCASGITFTTQSQIDSFPINYPNCTEIMGFAHINGNSITNLNGLNGITSFFGELKIQHCPLLTSLEGLNGVTSIGGTFWMYNLPSLADLGGLSGLISVDGNVLLGSEGGGLGLIEDLTGLNNLESVGGWLQISGNDSLISLSGLENLSSIGDGLVIWACNSLPNLDGIGSIDSLQEFTVHGNNALINLEGLESIVHIEEDVWIRENAVILSLDGLNNLISVGGEIDLWSNTSLSSLTGLNNLNSIGGRLRIYSNHKLSDISALLSLTSIGGELSIAHSDSLTTLNGIDNIDAESIQNLSIKYNPQLSTCEVQSVCDYLANPNGDIQIYVNATGCNNSVEVIEACTVGIGEQPSENKPTAYPIPFTTSTTIEYELSEPTHVHLTIYNSIGETIQVAVDRLMPVGKHTFTWSPESLPEGLYLAVLKSEEGVSVVKMIKL